MTTAEESPGTTAAEETPRNETDAVAPAAPPNLAWIGVGIVLVVVLGYATKYLDKNVPVWLAGTGLARISKSVEYPIYAIAIGLLGNLVLTVTGVRDRLAGGFRTEFFIKTGLVLLGASINLSLLVTAAGPAILQALLLISGVFLFTWWFAGKLGLEEKLRALLASAVSICGVSAAIAAAGAVRARREQLAYAASLVIVFALPSIFLLPYLADVLGLSDAVAGAWIGGNIDTTAAVTAAGALAGESALKVATIVKVTQNALIGFVAIALTAYFAFKVERSESAQRPGAIELWRRFPKFVLGFVAASIIGTWYAKTAAAADNTAAQAVATNLRTWFLIFAFVSIGLEFRVRSLREAGWRPVAVFAGATVVNIVLALALASLLFANFTV
ncbi:putative sulfate exporter family transporter [Dactylosporangium sp. AC04546]|uniref:YeiH family protein n=1 Tax=Dactylosporangium sp. AC04546 TaxID=2862460 RepID=UPI001EDD53E2|nr:putative sulfate exporter family transporter [Dactylosporangium sp. AC04546]WVK79337.1 putative sulfate exporter family transporter [Dactylosporangium sp. AC04546]